MQITGICTRSIELSLSTTTSTYYYGRSTLDDVIGTRSEGRGCVARPGVEATTDHACAVCVQVAQKKECFAVSGQQ